MTRSLRLLSLVAVALTFLLGACGNSVVSPAAAEVNGTKISQDALDDELEAIRGNREYLEFLSSQGNTVLGNGSGTFNADFVRRVLTRQIYLQLVHDEVKRLKIQVTGRNIDAVRLDVQAEVGGPSIFGKFSKAYQDTLLRRSAEVAALQLHLSDVDIDEATIRRYYEENQELFVETCVRHILFAVVTDSGQVSTEQTEAQSAELLAQAQAAKARIDSGADFAALAAELSKDSSNAADGGNLDCGPAGRFVPEFETAMDELQPGQVSDPVQTQFGYHLIKVDSREARPFEDAAAEIEQRLLGEASQGFGTFLSDAISSAEVEVNPRFGFFSKNLQNPGVLPPSAPTTLPIGGADQPPRAPAIDFGG
ncbi:MAG TPA: peptidylprolyl isomerase [Acidimicrobiales bacterium]|jgi:multidrug efflux pump subunit AcrA (membrane-fusion protein)|nr:peptidylprolyl isomerase [Acidimicrobiales bacterium]